MAVRSGKMHEFGVVDRCCRSIRAKRGVDDPSGRACRDGVRMLLKSGIDEKTDSVMRMVFIDRKFPSCYPYFIKAFGVDVARSFFGSAHAWYVCRAYFYIAREKMKEDRKR